MKRLTIALGAVVVVAAFSVPSLGAIVYSGSQNVTLALNPMSPMDSKTIPLAGMSTDWADFRVELWLDMSNMGMMSGMTGGMIDGMTMMPMRTKLAIYAPGSMGMGMGMGMSMGGVVALRGLALNLPLSAMVGADSFFDVWPEIYGSGEFREDGGYIGLRTGMGQYGWLHMLSQSNVGTDTHAVTFDGWAYEDQPGTPIRTGEGGPCDWRPGAPHKMHWPQLPDLGFTGIDISLEQATLADDFRCTATGPVRDIHIWGSFRDDVLPKEGPDSLTFEISIHSDVPASGKRWSLPGDRLWTRTFKPGEYTVRRVHNGPEDWYDPARGLYVPQNHRYAFQYNFCIDRDPFTQREGSIYWLAVTESSATGNYSFGWKTAVRESRWNDDAVYDQSGWMEMAYPKGHKYGGESLDLAFVITDGLDLLANRDLGDAPDSSNSVAGAQMLAYPSGVFAHFPTVYLAGSPPFGPIHLYPRDMYYLGKWVSLESEADIGLDDDGVTNIDPLNDAADRDGADDGLQLPVPMPYCQRTTLNYTVTVTNAAAQEAYVNVWCDWNRDGDWDDILLCPDGDRVPEWAVQNDKPAFAGVGTYSLTTSPFKCWHPVKDRIDPIWVRISIAEQEHLPSIIVPGAAPGIEGTGPRDGYKYGETEDYYIRPTDEPPAVKYDWGDAPESAAAPGYPTLAASNGARHVPTGPWLGDENGMPDSEPDGQPQADALGDDSTANDDENGVWWLPLFPGLPAATGVVVGGGGGVVQAWIDFNSDHTWQSSEKIFDGFLSDGIHTINFTTPTTAVIGQTFARFRISREGGLNPEGEAKDGEVEDHRLRILEPPEAQKQWCQRPDLTPQGIDIRVDGDESLPRRIADDFECRQPGRLTHVRLWGSWKGDRKGELKRLHLRIHPDDPVGPDGADARNKYSKPGPGTLWEGEFLTGQFIETLHHTVGIDGEWWWDPASGDAVPGGDKQVWQLDIDVSPEKAFRQEGTSESPRIYWLEVTAETADGQFGWKTRWWPEHFMDDAVFYGGANDPPVWRELFYPHGHKYYANERNSIDMAFCLEFEVDTVQPTSQPTSLTQCPVVQTTCPATVTECQTVRTVCPAVETSCPAVDTECPAISTRCPLTPTKCPATATECQVIQTECPAVYTKCPTSATKCPAAETRCPVESTKCPPTATECQTVETQCPTVHTKCPTSDTTCPAAETRCPVESTKCPPTATECQTVETQCPTVYTKCPTSPTKCPVISTRCPEEDTRCPEESTQCPPVQTQCPQPVTTCASPTACPGAACGNPELQPVYSIGTWVLGSGCPTVETMCRTVDDYLILAQMVE
ncbi:MAG: hypothetical protein JW955_17040 [Sedimentisphaerales bacterium]|nr:hypothetical protein [Sedimentisphaerales bacterium]